MGTVPHALAVSRSIGFPCYRELLKWHRLFDFSARDFLKEGNIVLRPLARTFIFMLGASRIITAHILIL
jgi:hypothetical protein